MQYTALDRPSWRSYARAVHIGALRMIDRALRSLFFHAADVVLPFHSRSAAIPRSRIRTGSFRLRRSATFNSRGDGGHLGELLESLQARVVSDAGLFLVDHDP